jgi:hypothetical protein
VESVLRLLSLDRLVQVLGHALQSLLQDSAARLHERESRSGLVILEKNNGRIRSNENSCRARGGLFLASTRTFSCEQTDSGCRTSTSRTHRGAGQELECSVNDGKERRYWKEYMQAYEGTIRNTATKAAPWYLVPADNKWFTRLVVLRCHIRADDWI